MPTKFRATFSDGTVLTRTSKDRSYSHAYRAKVQSPRADAQVYEVKGFARTKALADQALSTATSWYTTKPKTGRFRSSWPGVGTVHFAEVVAVEVVS